ncbi:MAG: hypothetical protein COA32_15080 [Fluviicola sp.]|nr:MAG: hypothetical protein COA32_15080 [Fluviicola sp.]
MKQLIFMLFLLYLLPNYAQGPIDGYLKGKGNLDVAIGMNFSRANEYYGVNNQSFDIPYSVEMLSVFAQYGITDKIDGVFSLPFIFGKEEKKFQDLGLHLKYKPIEFNFSNGANWSQLISAGFSFPASDYRPDVTGALGQRAKRIPLRFISQLKFENGLFFNFTGAYHFRLDEISQETAAMVLEENPDFNLRPPANHYSIVGRVGLATSKHFIEVFTEYQKTLGGVDYEEGVVKPSQLYGVDFLKVGGTYYFGMDENGIAVNASYIPALRRNIGNIFSVGISFIIKHYSKK